jgi:16S rRNA (cytidine1402-2'-O)-methyltransferase
MGFPPHKNKRQKFFTEVAEAQHTVAFFESTHRIKKCLGELKEVLEPNRQVVVCRELTKKFETVYRGTIEEATNQLTEERGEFVIVVNSTH